MKKKKQSKKRWAWTEKQRRSHFSRSRWDSIPSWYTRYLHRENKTLEKMAIHKYMRGNFEKDVVIKNQRSSTGYSWW